MPVYAEYTPKGKGPAHMSDVVPWRAVGTEGETRLAASGVTVRCLQRPDGGLPGTDDEPDLVAVVARAY